MEINEILASLGIDLTNPEARKGAMEAIDAILASRIDLSGIGGGGLPGGKPAEPIEVEIDPDLLQPSVKHHPPMNNDDDIEVEDEEDLLSKVKHNKSDDSDEQDDSESGNSSGDTTDGDDANESSDDTDDDTDDSDNDASDSESTESTADSDESEMSNEQEESDEQTALDDTGELEANDESEESEESEESDEADYEDAQDSDSENDGEESEGSGELDDLEDSDEADEYDANEEPEDDSEEDFLDDEIKTATKGGDADKKTEARKIKRERTLNAAKEALAKAQANKAPKALISELENAIAALETLVEAASKNIADLSDEEFNTMINRVFDAIDALGTGDLTYSTEEERQAKAKEIKADLSSTKTQAELSAEDAATIRAETQAVKARNAEADKYRTKSRKSFQGFQAFMDSLQRGIALQVSYEEERDDTWSAISRRNSGAGVLRQGQKINELPNKKVPIIDFYFDQSGSWDESDLEVGNQAVEALAKMQEDGKIKINIYYFSNNVYENAEDARNEGGTQAWNEIVKNIVVTEATNVVIMTDDDMENWWKGPKALKHTVSGFVWYLWRNGENAPRLPRDLQGRGGTMQYSC